MEHDPPIIDDEESVDQYDEDGRVDHLTAEGV